MKITNHNISNAWWVEPFLHCKVCLAALSLCWIKASENFALRHPEIYFSRSTQKRATCVRLVPCGPRAGWVWVWLRDLVASSGGESSPFVSLVLVFSSVRSSAAAAAPNRSSPVPNMCAFVPRLAGALGIWELSLLALIYFSSWGFLLYYTRTLRRQPAALCIHEICRWGSLMSLPLGICHFAK